MSIPVIAFFNNKGGVGKASLVFHLSWMLAERGLRIVAADLDPQCNLTASFLDDDRLEQLMPPDGHPETIFGSLQPLIRGIGDLAGPHLEEITPRLALVVGDMALSTFEDQLSEVWPKCLAGDERAFRVTSAFWRILQRGAEAHQADVVLVDLGPNLGAINRAALIAADFVVIPLGLDFFSLQSLRYLGPVLRGWREGWEERIRKNPAMDLELPPGTIRPIGYVLIRPSIRLDRPVWEFERWMNQMPYVYKASVLDQRAVNFTPLASDPNCIARLKDYRSLAPLAQEARKPMFALKPGDGAIGAHASAVQHAYEDFLHVGRTIAQRAGIEVP